PPRSPISPLSLHDALPISAFTPDSHVAQEGLHSLRRFLVQRTRWGQGTMQCARYLRRIWDSPHISTLGAAEMLYYLAQPWMQLLDRKSTRLNSSHSQISYA